MNADKFAGIKTARLSIFLPDADRAEDVCDFFVRNREHLSPTMPGLPRDFFTRDFWRPRLTRSLEDFASDKSARFFFERHDLPGAIIGTANLTEIVRVAFQACFLGYSLDKANQGQGYMFEALTAVVQFAFDEKHLHRIMANHLPDSERSARVLQRIGFHVDGISPEYLYINGKWRDHVLTSLTNPRWTPRNEDRDLFT